MDATTLPSHAIDLAGLDPEQRAAVEHDQGPLLIVAGAGTGKTTVVTRRIAHLIAAGRARPSEILALTFNEKAAAEMQERVDEIVPYGYADAHIGTFHAFGEDALSAFGVEIGIAPGFTVLDQTAQAMFLAEHLEELKLRRYAPLSDPTRYLTALAAFFNRAKDEPLRPEDLAAHAARVPEPDEAERLTELARAYARYNAALWRLGFLDFGDLLALTLRLFEESPATLRHVQDRFRYVLVDEFQDTNPVQFKVVRRLVERHGNLVVVGDDDQSIYRFRGAHLQNILGFEETYPDARRIVLRRNYRSTQEILDVARRLILVNRERLEVRRGISKELRSDRSGPAPRIREFATESEEADGVASDILSAVTDGRRRFRDFAILVRTNRHAEPFLRALDERRVPYYFSGSRGLFQRPEVKHLIALLHALFQETRHEYLYLLAVEGYGVPESDVARLAHALERVPVGLRALMERAIAGRAGVEVSDEGRRTLAALLEDLAALRDFARGHRTGEVLYRYLERRGLLKRLASSERFEDEVVARNIVKFFSIIRSFEKIAVHDRVPLFLRHLDAIREHGEDPAVAEIDAAVDVVQVLTIHKAKGLEFPVVYLVEAASDRFPVRYQGRQLEVPAELVEGETPGSDAHKEEERRLCYVALTRARDELVATYALDYGGTQLRRRSEFLSEAFDLGKPVPERRRRRVLEELEEHQAGAPPAPAAGRPGPREPLHLSAQRLEDYETCPLKYRFLHLLAVEPILTRDHRVNFGHAMHQAVAFALEGRRRGEPVTIEAMVDAFRGSWRSEGYRSEEHERRRFEQGVAALRAFYDREVAGGPPPTAIELPFRLKLEDVVVSGRIDRVDASSDGRGGSVVVDYKTSELDDAERADPKARESLQLSVYALALREIEGRVPGGVELRYVLTGAVGRAPRTEAHIEKTRARLLAIARAIRAGDFRARPSERNCSICACRPICMEAAV